MSMDMTLFLNVNAAIRCSTWEVFALPTDIIDERRPIAGADGRCWLVTTRLRAAPPCAHSQNYSHRCCVPSLLRLRRSPLNRCTRPRR